MFRKYSLMPMERASFNLKGKSCIKDYRKEEYDKLTMVKINSEGSSLSLADKKAHFLDVELI